jgi:hypothetical protein
MAAGPLSPPPQAARAFVRWLFGRRRGGPEVTATLVDDRLELFNGGGDVAVGLRYATEAGSHAVGNLEPGQAVDVRVEVAEPFRCVWTCTDGKGRRRVWSYDGRHRRLRGDADPYRLMY